MGLADMATTQWTHLMSQGPWSESFTVKLDPSYKAEDFTVSGIFCSGTSGEASPAQAYAPKKAVRKEMLRIATASLPPAVSDPKRMLQGALISSADRGSFRVMEVRGEKSGTLSLMLNTKGVLS